jgi:hypothetical protein
MQFEIKPSDNKIWLDLMEKSLDEVLVGMLIEWRFVILSC